MNLPKFWLKSKTILFNLALALVGLWSTLEASIGNLRATLSPAEFGLVLAVVGIVGVVLRVLTTTAIAVKKENT